MEKTYLRTYLTQALANKGKLYKISKSRRNKGFDIFLNKYVKQLIGKSINSNPLKNKMINDIYRGNAGYYLHNNNLFPIKRGVKTTTINLGIEWEFWGEPTSSQIKEFKLYKEYYNNMWEKTFFFKNVEPTKKAIVGVLKQCLEQMKYIQKQVKNCKISSRPIKVDDVTLVFNGLHIHLSVNSDVYHHDIRFTDDIYDDIDLKWVIKQKWDKLPSYRSIVSHHLFGAYRHYGNSYKQKRRFRPIHYTPYNTIEFRLFDVEDAIFSQRREKVAGILLDVVNKNTKASRLRLFDDSSNIVNICEQISKYFKGNTFRVLADDGNTMMVRTNLTKIELHRNENYLEILEGGA